MNFTAIDVETANADMGSICQIGLARFAGGRLVEEWSSLIDPEDYFDEVNISVHGIEPGMVRGKPRLPEVASKLHALMSGTVTVCHTHFDRVALGRAFTKYGLSPVPTAWLDSARVVRRTWNDLASRGYGLANVCQRIGYEFQHHDALEDAKAAGHVLLAALEVSRLDLEAWLCRVNQPIDLAQLPSAIRRDGNPEGDLYGEVLVFTGALDLTRREAADLAARLGCEVAANVSKRTTVLVVGDQDVAVLAGHEKSTKHRKAENLISQGVSIRIINESGFKDLTRIDAP